MMLQLSVEQLSHISRSSALHNESRTVSDCLCGLQSCTAHAVILRSNMLVFLLLNSGISFYEKLGMHTMCCQVSGIRRSYLGQNHCSLHMNNWRILGLKNCILLASISFTLSWASRMVWWTSSNSSFPMATWTLSRQALSLGLPSNTSKPEPTGCQWENQRIKEEKTC